MFRQYGKSSTALLMQKKSFFEENSKHLKKQQDVAEIYSKQPSRENCKNCNQKLSNEIDFEKDNIGYKICQTCTHLNGIFVDSNDFCEAVYTNDDGKKYAENYQAINQQDFNYRVSSIYIPKADFLFTSLKNDHQNPNELKYLDFGAGSGYFTTALKKVGLTQVKGTEVSKYQVDIGNQLSKENLLSIHSLEETDQLLSKADVNVISLIGVLEHLQDPRSALQAIAGNNNVEYLYLSVPLFGLATYIGLLSDEVFHRQLHGGHNHLYTEKSLQYLAKDFNFEIISEWWFGADIIDLYRNIYVNLEKKDTSNILKENYMKTMSSLIDSMQIEIDKKHQSSEVHMLLKKKK